MKKFTNNSKKKNISVNEQQSSKAENRQPMNTVSSKKKNKPDVGAKHEGTKQFYKDGEKTQPNNRNAALPQAVMPEFKRERKLSANLRPPTNVRMDDPAETKKFFRKLDKLQVPRAPQLQHRPEIVGHLPCFDFSKAMSLDLNLSGVLLHPQFIRLAYLASRHPFMDDNEIIAGFVCCFKNLVTSYQFLMKELEKEGRNHIEGSNLPPPSSPSSSLLLQDDEILCRAADNNASTVTDSNLSRNFSQEFLNILNRHVSLVDQATALNVGLRCLINQIKKRLEILLRESTEEIMEDLLKLCDDFVARRLDGAVPVIINEVQEYIHYGSRIIVHGSSPLVLRVLLALLKKFRDDSAVQLPDSVAIQHRMCQPCMEVLVVETEPISTSSLALKLLRSEGVPCALLQYNEILSELSRRETDFVLLSGYGLLNNGCILGTSGSTGLANAAKLFGCHVVLCMETCKFWERTQLDAFEYNKTVHPDFLSRQSRPTVSDQLQHKKLECNGERTTSDIANHSDSYALLLGLDLIQQERISVLCCDVGSVIPSVGSIIQRHIPCAEYEFE